MSLFMTAGKRSGLELPFFFFAFSAFPDNHHHVSVLVSLMLLSVFIFVSCIWILASPIQIHCVGCEKQEAMIA